MTLAWALTRVSGNIKDFSTMLEYSYLRLVAALILCAVLGMLGSCKGSGSGTQGISVPASRLPTATEVFHLRSECAKLGEGILEGNPIGSALTDSQVSHYNPLTNRCYVELDVQNADLSGPVYYLHRTLWDGQTGELLASVEVNGSNCPSLAAGECKRTGEIFGAGEAMIQANKALGNTDNYAGHDSATQPEAFIDNVMEDDRKR